MPNPASAVCTRSATARASWSRSALASRRSGTTACRAPRPSASTGLSATRAGPRRSRDPRDSRLGPAPRRRCPHRGRTPPRSRQRPASPSPGRPRTRRRLGPRRVRAGPRAPIGRRPRHLGRPRSRLVGGAKTALDCGCEPRRVTDVHDALVLPGGRALLAVLVGRRRPHRERLAERRRHLPQRTNVVGGQRALGPPAVIHGGRQTRVGGTGKPSAPSFARPAAFPPTWSASAAACCSDSSFTRSARSKPRSGACNPREPERTRRGS